LVVDKADGERQMLNTRQENVLLVKKQDGRRRREAHVTCHVTREHASVNQRSRDVLGDLSKARVWPGVDVKLGWLQMESNSVRLSCIAFYTQTRCLI